METIETLALNKKELSKKDKDKIKELLWLFVINSPCQNGVFKNKKFADYNIKSPQDHKKQIEKIKKILGVSDKNYIFDKKLSDIKIPDTLNTAQTYIWFLKADSAQCDSLYKRIRNALAHNNFIIYKKRILLWNYDRKKFLSYMNVQLSDLEEIALI